GIYRGVLQPETSPLIRGVRHKGPSQGRPPRPPRTRHSITPRKNTKYCSALLTQPTTALTLLTSAHTRLLTRVHLGPHHPPAQSLASNTQLLSSLTNHRKPSRRILIF